MRRCLVIWLCLLAPAPAAGAAELMVVGRGGETLLAPRTVGDGGAKVKVDGRRCRVPGRTGLALLVRSPLALVLEDFGSCSKRAADAGGLYIAGVEGQRERGADGWVFKVGNRAPSVGAGDPSGRLGARARVLWFWCEMGSDGCQRTLAVRASVESGDVIARVRAYDDMGKGVPAVGARVVAGSSSAVTGADGSARLQAPPGGGPVSVVATKAGLVRSFAARVTVP